MKSLKSLLGIHPRADENDSFSPSPLALKLATQDKTNYDYSVYENSYPGHDLKVLMVCTEEKYMTMKNGEKFSTGNHPVEMLVPMLHLEQAGFDIDIATPSGKPVQIEMWAMPGKDQAVQGIFERYKVQFENPFSLSNLVKKFLTKDSSYVAVFIPGGHGAMLGLPENEDLKKLIHWTIKENRHILSICHGPAALLSAGIDEDEKNFLFKGYKIAAFPDSLDKQTPLLGYMPGHMPWYFGERLKNLGVEIVNKAAGGKCCQDRNLITGDSPKAANRFGKMAAEALLKSITS